MRLILFYDLPVTEKIDQKHYLKFHRWIISRGYIMIQYSIYIKMINTPLKLSYEQKAIQKNTPDRGNVRLLMITEHQYHNIRYLRGVPTNNEKINNNERYLKI